MRWGVIIHHEPITSPHDNVGGDYIQQYPARCDTGKGGGGGGNNPPWANNLISR